MRSAGPEHAGLGSLGRPGAGRGERRRRSRRPRVLCARFAAARGHAGPASCPGSYLFGASHDAAARITVNGVRVYGQDALPRHQRHPVGERPAVSLNAGSAVPITIEYAEKAGAAYLTAFTKTTDGTNRRTILPTGWLSPSLRASLPGRR